MFDNDMTKHDSNEHNRSDHEPTRASRRRRAVVGAAALLLAGGIAGGALAATSSASAAGTSTPSAAAPGPRGRADTATSVRAGEKAQTGTVLATLKAAALKAVPGGTVYRVETDADGATYEAHMTKADGTFVTVKFDKSFAVTAVQAGMGSGGPGQPAGATGRGGPGGPGGATPSASAGAGL
jgi:hypothetical protein